MAREVRLVCDNPNGKPGGCNRPAFEWKIWRDGEAVARRADLCEVHARPLQAIWDRGVPERLPARPRKGLAVTELRTTAATAGLKKPSDGNG